MKIILSLSKKKTQKLAHSHECDVNVCDRITAVLVDMFKTIKWRVLNCYGDAFVFK